LSTSISPGVEWGGALYLKYNDSRVIDLLSLIKSGANKERINTIVNSILDGSYEKYINSNIDKLTPIPNIICGKSDT
jgi:hypothetical protein